MLGYAIFISLFKTLLRVIFYYVLFPTLLLGFLEENILHCLQINPALSHCNYSSHMLDGGGTAGTGGGDGVVSITLSRLNALGSAGGEPSSSSLLFVPEI